MEGLAIMTPAREAGTGTPPAPIRDGDEPAVPATFDMERLKSLPIRSLFEAPPVRARARQTRNLNDAVHTILIVGLAVSTFFLLVGLALDAIQNKALPVATLAVGDAVQGVLQLRPSGFLSLGLIILMATPIVRVMGSIVAFVWEHDVRYSLVTLLVFINMIVSILVGRD